ncbi:O-methyltransferase [Aquisalibacillus elongatus]|uniref:tRNA 5-hydroxyuridine methyltransferase n=1 Tax=Aquisalibacillus elongatus TaxID=485577 RepID=A0A3N5CAA5_9BACI|nr:O-methyltransferase [Aquisalibacillus elongatus]RPF55545.1 putative O-methyltransferase YrrM [Aquisalibacillus elongatus]
MSKTYIQKLYNDHKPQQDYLEEMEAYALEHQVPIMERDGIELLKQLVRLHQPKTILEIGTAIGYSAIQMAIANEKAHITSIEIDESHKAIAEKNIQKAGLDHQIDVVLSDANEYLEQHQHAYDLVFVDAAKGQYKNYIEKLHPILESGSLIIIDNVLFKGYVSKEVQGHKRFDQLGEKINQFNQWLIEHPHFETTIVETGDGVAIALKR